LKILKKNEELCIKCHKCEDTCSRTWFKQDNREKSCIRIDEEPFKMTTCTQCGECIEVCPANAISRDKLGVVRINKRLCVGCFICVGFCPEGAMFMHRDYIEPFKCISCGRCTESCPTGAIEIVEE
jgi:anaerobic carbon-monoxide dehydrogenase iron sulfur subunit